MEKENNKLEIQKPFSKIPFLSYLGALASILISIIGPIIGIVCGSVAIGISAKEKSIEAKHMMFYNILLIISSSVIFLVSFIKGLSLN